MESLLSHNLMLTGKGQGGVGSDLEQGQGRQECWKRYVTQGEGTEE